MENEKIIGTQAMTAILNKLKEKEREQDAAIERASEGAGVFNDTNIIVEKDGLYQVKDHAVYPVAHPDLSTQPSVLPQRFGNLPIHEVLIANGREDEIPMDATVLSAWSFNNNECVAAVCEKSMAKKKIVLHNVKLGFNLPINVGSLTYSPLTFDFDATAENIVNYLKVEFTDGPAAYWQIGDNEATLVQEANLAQILKVVRGGSPREWVMSYMNSQFNTLEISKITYSDGVTKEISAGWSITNDEGIIPDFTLVRYIGADNGYYYESGAGGEKDSFDPFVDDTDDGECVDLGLPSGTLWAKSNVGATKPSEYGLYFQWGDYHGYPDANSGKIFNWDSYVFGKHDSSASPNYGMTKYNATDGKPVLDYGDDAAAANSQNVLRMPTQDELQELIDYTSYKFITLPNGVKGMKFVNKSDASKYIFIPAAGYCGNNETDSVNQWGHVWSASRDSSVVSSAWNIIFNAADIRMSTESRFGGFSVRGVLADNEH